MLLLSVFPFYVQPGDDYEVVPGSQFVVSRTARKDNSSDYHVNGRKAPFKDVARLLKDCGIDLDHNRFLILQVSCGCCGSILFLVQLLLTCECNEQVIEVNRFGTHSVGQSFPVNLLT